MIRASVLALLVLLATSGCGALTGRPMETWAQDRSLTARVKTRLAAADAVRTYPHKDGTDGFYIARDGG